jgi:hypothetical protein
MSGNCQVGCDERPISFRGLYPTAEAAYAVGERLGCQKALHFDRLLFTARGPFQEAGQCSLS